MGRLLRMASALVLLSTSGCATANIYSEPTSSTQVQVDSDQFSGLDQMFAQMMIPHHQQAITMAEMALLKSSNPEILALAEQIKEAQSPEIQQMEAWITDGVSGDHSGHGVNMGMLTEDELAELDSAVDREFDKLFLIGMIAHHEGAIEMTEMIQNSSNPEARALADAIVSGQSQEIQLMTELLAKNH